MNGTAYVDPLDRPKLTIGEVVALQAELAAEGINPERRDEIRKMLRLARDREEVALYGREPHDRLVFSLCREVLVEDEIRQQEAAQRARDARQAAAREERRLLVEGRPSRFAALHGPLQAAMYAESQATDARAGWKAYGEALGLQAAGKPIPVPWLFETELLTLGELRQLQGRGIVDERLVDKALQRDMREAME